MRLRISSYCCCLIGLGLCVVRLGLAVAPAPPPEPPAEPDFAPVAGTSSPGTNESFAKLVGSVDVKAVQEGAVLQVPFITWGGDVATFHANGGLTTKPGTIFDKQGLNLKLTNGDDFVGQVNNYMAGKTPFLRGTFSMLGEASEVTNADPRTQAVVFLQLTWSAGDHIVARENCKALGDLKGKRVAIQRGGPHSGMLGDTLVSAGLTWNDIEVVWVDDLTGDKGPAALFEKDPTISACTVISPDMAALTGDFDLTSVGTGQNGTVRGAHLLNSTAMMTRSICDVYACRKDYFDAHKDKVESFTIGYLLGCEELLDQKKLYDDKQPAPAYEADLKLAKEIFGDEAIPTTDDAHGLLCDCNMVLMPGNKKFFTDKRFLVGFDRKQQKVLDLAFTLQRTSKKLDFLKPDFDYDGGGFKEELKVQKEVQSDELVGIQRVLHSFEIPFLPNDPNFNWQQFVTNFQLAVEQSAVFGGAIIVIRGHADPSLILYEFKKQGRADGTLAQTNGQWYYKGDSLDLSDTKKVVQIVRKDGFSAAVAVVDACKTLSEKRAKEVLAKLNEYADSKGLDLEDNQFQVEGVGAVEAKIPVATSLKEAKENMRVQFRLQTFPVEAGDEIFKDL